MTDVCNYPECKCPFDLCQSDKCAKGYTRKTEEERNMKELLKEKDGIKIGSWVSFYNCGRLTIAEVRYIRKSNSAAEVYELCTDLGTVKIESVIEVRG